MTHIQVGISALRTAQTGLNTTAQNIANASTDGYHRQRVELVDRPAYYAGRAAMIGGGVEVAQITRLRNATVEQALTANISGREAANAQLSVLQQIERALTPGDHSIHALVSEFFDRVEHLATSPAESVLRREVLSTAEQLASAIRDVSVSFAGLTDDLLAEAGAVVDQVNSLAAEIADINRAVRVATARGQTANSLLDQRDRLVNQLATLVDIDASSLLNGSDPILAAGGALIIGEVTTTLSLQDDGNGQLQLSSSTGQNGIDIRGGKLGGLIASARAIDSGIGADFAAWARSLMREIDTVQATGIGLNGPSAALAGQRTLGAVDVPLSAAGSLFELTSGDLAITVTDALGQRRTSVISIDVANDSLQDVVARMDSLSGVTAEVTDVGSVALRAAPGFTLDFAGRTDQRPESTAITGTAAAEVSGTFLGSANTVWQVESINGGEIGVSSNVTLRVTDSGTGRVIGDFDFGAGYPPGQAVEIADGVKLALSVGTLNTGDSFTVRVTSQPDETGLLASLGLGTLFTGNSLAGLSVDQRLTDSPENLAASRSGQAGDGRQLDRLIALRTRALFSSGTESVEERLAYMTASSGVQVATQQADIGQRDSRQLQLENARDSVSGVDPNEELLQMLEFQRAFQAASRFVTSIDETLDELMRLIN